MPRFLVLLALVLGLPSAERGLMPLRVVGDGGAIGEFAESHALVIGCSAYRGGGWQRLDGVPGDVAAVATALAAQGFAVQRLDDPDGARLQQALRDLVVGPGASERNRVLVYFAGHGATIRLDDGRELGCVVPVDAPDPRADAAGFRRVALGMGQVELLARDAAARHVLFVFDACFSGSLFRLRAGPQPPPALQAKLLRPVRQFITSGTAEQTVPDQSVFRRYFVRGIAGEADANHDGWITGTELGEYVITNTANDTRQAQVPQLGTIRDPELNAGDFVFRGLAAPVAAPAPQPAPAAADARDRLEIRAVLAEYPNAAFPSLKPGDAKCAWIALGDGGYALNPLIPPGDGQERIVPFAPSVGTVPNRFLGLGPLRLSGRDIEDARLERDETGQPSLGVTFTELGMRRNLAFTTELADGRRRLAIVYDGIVRSDPAVREPIGRHGRFTGRFTSAEIEALRRALLSARSTGP